MKKNLSIIESSIFVAFGMAVIIGSLKLDSFGELVLSPGLFPLLLGILIILLSTLMLARNIKLKTKEVSSTGKDNREATHRCLQFLLFVGISLLYILIMKQLHFIIATILYVFVTMWFLGERRWWSLLVFPVVVSLLIYLCFDKGLNVYLP